MIRIAMVALILVYEVLFAGRWALPATQLFYVVGLTLLSQALALMIFSWIIWKPQRSHPRRVIGMLADYGLMSMAMSAIGEPMACIYVVVMWVTIGNGLRFGSKYLYLAVAMAMVSFGITLLTNDYWGRNFGLGVGLWLGLAAIPLYLSGLLNKLTRAMAEARRASEAKSRFLANMSHEFRTPLNGLSGMTEVLATTRLDAEQRECLSTIQASARSLLSLVEEVLDISAIEAGKVRVEHREFALRGLFGTIDLILQPQAKAKGIEYAVVIAPDVPDLLKGDAGHLRQILLNLAGNAVKFTDRGHVDVNIGVVARPAANKVRLRVDLIDSGIGVPVDMQPRLFEAFEQADNGLARRFEGSGLGTTIAKGLVESMGGEIGFEENPSGGSHFWFELPFEYVVESNALAKKQGSTTLENGDAGNVIAFADPFLRHRARVRSMQILVADDHAANRMVLQRLLQKAGHKVTCVNGGEHVLDTLAEADFDAAIVDLHMPGVSGLDLLKHLRVMQAGNQPRTPVVVLSADVTPEAIRSCEQAGAYAFLAKPIVAVKLLDTLAEIATQDKFTRVSFAPLRIGSAPDGVLDGTVLDELASLGMGKNFEKEFIRQCLIDAESCIVAMSGDAQASDWERLREHAHATKGVASNLGLVVLAEQGGELMGMSDAQIKSEWQMHVNQLQHNLQLGRAALESRAKERFEKDSDEDAS
ncbi:Sensory/regulatory protein RpfC [Xanthomonas hortorum pv. carotae]|uniref:Sensory/regulatory protein RpfC n=2 Tax=Xanthomonas TaxID=338 RepID=A0A6V7EKZ2_9XANT|nr:Sensory/regulatory protein RpfC [Xanthomonas hortorum pv. carotae]CAD0351880.1 Sensory/regulatory protein RpfC [Xanthomonas hortorum pv. carotae]